MTSKSHSPRRLNATDRLLDELHECRNEEQVDRWLDEYKWALNFDGEIGWIPARRADGRWHVEHRRRSARPFIQNLLDDAERANHLIGFASSAGGFAIKPLPQIRTTASGDALCVPSCVLAWCGSSAPGCGFVFIAYSLTGIDHAMCSELSRLLPHLFFVSKMVRARIRYERQATSPAPQLTEVERALLKQLVRGKPDREIALARGRSMNTVRNQVRMLLRKLGVTRRAQAHLAAERCGLLDSRIDIDTQWNVQHH